MEGHEANQHLDYDPPPFFIYSIYQDNYQAEVKLQRKQSAIPAGLYRSG